jgi:hypothetical protein
VADYTVKQGDSAPSLTDTLTYSTGDAVDLTGATVKFVMRSMTSARPMTLTGAVSVPTPMAGHVQYTPSTDDTASAGMFMANWVVTFPDTSVMTFPTVGYLWVTVEENLTTVGGQQLVSLPDLKDYLNEAAVDRHGDAKLIRLIHAVRPVVERITGPILPQMFDEWHDGGQSFIQLRRTPSTGFGTTPILNLVGVDEYRGPAKYPLAIVADPAHGSIYSCMVDRLGTVTRRTAGGGVTAFPAQSNAVHAIYQAGQSSVPPNVYEGTLELLRVNYQTTQQVGRGRLTVSDDLDASGPPLGFFVPRRVRELLSPSRRAPSVF